MVHDTHKQSHPGEEAYVPKNIFGRNEAQTKQPIAPLEEDDMQKDQHKGNLDNGEPGAGFRKQNDKG